MIRDAAMLVAFSAKQSLRLLVSHQGDRLADYLKHDERVIKALLQPSQLQVLAATHYRYNMRRLKVFQLQVRPVVDLRTMVLPQRLEISSCGCQLEGLDPSYVDFHLQLNSWLQAEADHLVGEAALAVEVKRPPILSMIPHRVLQASGRRILINMIGGIRARVAQQIIPDFKTWCGGTVTPTSRSTAANPSTSASAKN